VPISITINHELAQFEVSQLSTIKYFRDKWSSDPSQCPPSSESFDDASLSMAAFIKLVVFANNENRGPCALRKLGIVAQDMLSFLKTAAFFGVHDLTMAMMDEYFDSYPAVPGIPHRVLTSWYHAKIRALPIVTKFATKKMTEIYQLFNLPNVQRAKDIMEHFANEHGSLYDDNGAFVDGVTRERVEGTHYELLINFCHFYQCLVWSDFHSLIQTVVAVVRDFNQFAERADTVTARFETFPFHEALFCILGWVRKLKQHNGPQTRQYAAELHDVISLIPPLMNHYFCSRMAQRRWHEQMPWIAEHYFPKLFVREVEGDGEGHIKTMKEKVEKKEEEDRTTGDASNVDGDGRRNRNGSNQKEEEPQDPLAAESENGNGNGSGSGQWVRTEDVGKVADPYFGSLGMELYKCIIIEVMQFAQFTDYAVDEMLKPLLVFTFGRDEQWVRRRIMTRINQKCALRITSILYHEVIHRFQATGGAEDKFIEPEYKDVIHTYSGLTPLKMIQSIFKHKAECDQQAEEQKGAV